MRLCQILWRFTFLCWKIPNIKAFLYEHANKLLVCLVLVIQLAFAFALYLFVTQIKEIVVEKHTHWYTPWTSVIAAAIATAGALITLYTNKRLSEIQFDRRALESSFADILNRFASENPIIRANAAIRLGEIAQKQWPGKSERETLDNYPFFPNATAQLAAALQMEHNKAVRDEVEKALARTAIFAEQDNQLLLYLLVRELSDANRNAKYAFREALAEGTSRVENVTSEQLRPLIPFASFCEREEDSLSYLQALADSNECKRAATAKAIRRKGLTDEARKEGDLKLLPDIEASAKRLISTRDALATALRALAAPRKSWWAAPYPKGWKRRLPFALDECFLAGAKLEGAHLQGLQIRQVALHGADLKMADLQCADLSFAQLNGATMFGAFLQDTTLENAQLQRAFLQGARLHGAGLFFAQAQGASFARTDLREANLAGADFTGADLEGAFLAGAVVETPSYLYPLVVAAGRSVPDPANFSNTNWWKADFDYLPSKSRKWKSLPVERDQRLKKWLDEHFPLPQEKATLLDEPPTQS